MHFPESPHPHPTVAGTQLGTEAGWPPPGPWQASASHPWVSAGHTASTLVLCDLLHQPFPQPGSFKHSPRLRPDPGSIAGGRKSRGNPERLVSHEPQPHTAQLGCGQRDSHEGQDVQNAPPGPGPGPSGVRGSRDSG